jgi:prefoldin subunit 5
MARPNQTGDLPMSHAQSAETYARQVAAKSTLEEKLDAIARSLVEMAQAIEDLDRKISRLPVK